MAKIGEKAGINASLLTVEDARLPLYPVGRPKPKAVIETSWGTVRFDNGVPTSKHRDILDAIAVCALATKVDAVGRKHVLFDAVDVIKLLRSDDWCWLREKLEELVTTSITIKRPGSDWGTTRAVLAGADDAEAFADRAGAQFGARLKKIIFSELMTKLLEQDVLVHMRPEITKMVLFLDYQVSRSLARWCLSHTTDQHHQIDVVLRAIGCTGSDRNFRRYKQQLRDDATGLKALGIEIDAGIVHYARQNGVWFHREGAEQISAGSSEERNNFRLEAEQLSVANEGLRNNFRLELRDS